MIFRTLSDLTTIEFAASAADALLGRGLFSPLTLVLADIFQSKGQAGILSLHDPHLSESPFPDDAEEFEVIEVD